MQQSQFTLLPILQNRIRELNFGSRTIRQRLRSSRPLQLCLSRYITNPKSTSQCLCNCNPLFFLLLISILNLISFSAPQFLSFFHLFTMGKTVFYTNSLLCSSASQCCRLSFLRSSHFVFLFAGSGKIKIGINGMDLISDSPLFDSTVWIYPHGDFSVK